MENDTVAVANTNKTTLSRPLSESEYPPLWSILPDPRGTEDVMSKASARLKSSLKIVAVADEDEWYERVNSWHRRRRRGGITN